MTNLEKVMLLNTVGVDYHVYYHYKKNCFICLSMDEAKRYKNIIETPYLEMCQVLARCIRYEDQLRDLSMSRNVEKVSRALEKLYVTEEDIENAAPMLFEAWETQKGISIDWDTVIGL